MAALKINENEQTPVHFVSIEPSHAFGQNDVCVQTKSAYPELAG